MTSPNISPPTQEIMNENLEKVAVEEFGLDAATAELDYDLGEGDYRFDVSFEGELEHPDSMLFIKTELGIHMVWPKEPHPENEYHHLFMYSFRPVEQLTDIKD
ncbi:hypothetical protein, partial [Haloferax profundi]|uniref:hypothetical protein n=1 Tax=Haloferax profundi TaxID=1544718 RepID=UPI0012FA4A9E